MPRSIADKLKAAVQEKAKPKKKKKLTRDRWAPNPLEVEYIVDVFINNGFSDQRAQIELWPDCSPTTRRNRWNKVIGFAQFNDALKARTTQMARQFRAERSGVIAEWVNHAHANIFDYLQQDDQGNLVVRKDLNDLEAQVQRRIKKIDIRTDRIGTQDDDPIMRQTIKLELVDTARALDALSRYLQLYAEEKDKASTDLAEQLRKRIGRIEGRVLEAPKE